jgi:sn-glycerol 3-phosphate transport system ATP-binding protein
MASITLKHVSKVYEKNVVINDLDLTIKDGGFTVLVGPSGCGKTTLLRMIAGIGPQFRGRILIDGEDVTDIPPGKRDIAMVFQNYAIYPTMTVRENIEFGLKNNKVPKAERQRLIEEVSQAVGLDELLGRKPSTLSGGQRQRIALARAMVKKPNVFLMDEPLSNLDAKLRVAMRIELIELHKKLKTTFVYVTHDQVEAMSMADDIVLMDKGRIMQQAPPEAIYHDPDNIFTAQFIGSPSMNIFPFGSHGYRFGFRSERAVLSRDLTSSGGFTWRGRIITREMLGSETLYQVMIRQGSLMVKTFDEGFHAGEEITVSVSTPDLYFFDLNDQRIRTAQDVEECQNELKGHR